MPDPQTAQREALKRAMDWADSRTVGDYCPVCGAPTFEVGHNPECWVSVAEAALAAIPVPVPAPSGTPDGLCTACSATQYCAEHEPVPASAPEPTPEEELQFSLTMQATLQVALDKAEAEIAALRAERDKYRQSFEAWVEQPWTMAERRELAEHMIAAWTAYRDRCREPEL